MTWLIANQSLGTSKFHLKWLSTSLDVYSQRSASIYARSIVADQLEQDCTGSAFSKYHRSSSIADVDYLSKIFKVVLWWKEYMLRIQESLMILLRILGRRFLQDHMIQYIKSEKRIKSFAKAGKILDKICDRRGSIVMLYLREWCFLFRRFVSADRPFNVEV